MGSLRRQIVPLPRKGGGLNRGQMGEDDMALVARAGVGDAPAFGVLASRHLGSVIATARRLVRDHAEAEDIAQETMLRLWREASKLEIGPVGVGPWLRRVAANLAIDRLRSSGRIMIAENVPEQEAPATQLDSLVERDVSRRVNEALFMLPERQRVALVLFHYEGMSQREVATRLDVSEDAVESLLSRARRALRVALKDEWRSLLQEGT